MPQRFLNRLRLTVFQHQPVRYKRNKLSFASSYAVAKLTGLEPMGHYFKPFTSYGLIIAISVVAIIVHTIIVLIYKAKKKAD